MKHLRWWLGILLSSIVFNTSARADNDPKAAAILYSDFTQQVQLRIDLDGYSDAVKLLALHGNAAEYKRSKDYYSSCVSQRFPYAFGGNLVGLNGGDGTRTIKHSSLHNWLETNGLVKWETYTFGSSDTFKCPIFTDAIKKYISARKLNGVVLLIGRRELSKWTFENQYETPYPAKGNVKVFAGSFTYRMVPAIPLIKFPGEGTAKIKMYLDPDDGRWTIISWEASDPTVVFVTASSSSRAASDAPQPAPSTITGSAPLIPALTKAEALQLAESAHHLPSRFPVQISRRATVGQAANTDWPQFVAAVKRLRSVFQTRGWAIRGLEIVKPFYYQVEGIVDPPVSANKWMLGDVRDRPGYYNAVFMETATHGIDSVKTDGDSAIGVFKIIYSGCTEFCQMWKDFRNLPAEVKPIFDGLQPYVPTNSKFVFSSTVRYSWVPGQGWRAGNSTNAATAELAPEQANAGVPTGSADIKRDPVGHQQLTTLTPNPPGAVARSETSKALICGSPVQIDIEISTTGDTFRPLLGVWVGSWNNGRICSGLVVRKVNANGEADVVYSYRLSGSAAALHSENIKGKVDSDKVLSFEDKAGSHFTFHLEKDHKLYADFVGSKGNKLTTAFEAARQ